MSITCPDCKLDNKGDSKFCGICGMPLKGITGIGYILDRRYEIMKVLKEGGMGCVYKAKDIRLESECAVKEMLSEIEDQEYTIKRFQEEALILSSLRHMGLPVVRDYFIEQGKYYLIMDFIKGQDMQTLLDDLDGKPMEEEDVITLAIQILEVLDYLHNQSPPVVYRDLKPGNIMQRARDKRFMLVDFGIARTIRPDTDSTKTIIGTFGYCALEQIKGKPEIKSDIYSMGATMHHMLTGIQPQLLELDPLDKINPGISKKLAKIVNKSIQEKPENRFNSAKEMIEALLSSDMPIKFMTEEYPDMIYIPAGEFWMGNNDGDPNEYPQHKLFVKAFLIDKYPVTNEQFEKFLKETGIKSTYWRKYFKAGQENVPVVNVSWQEATQYAEWAGKRLPSEAEWEKAARGTDGRKFPWGDKWEDGPIDASSIPDVGNFMDRASPFGVMDMVGCIYEWTQDWYHPYPYKGPYETGKTKVVKGGRTRFATCSYRSGEIPDYRSSSRGFRCVIQG